MFIQTETTPNPDTIKFLPGQTVSASGNFDFRTPEDAEISPLAARLYNLDGVTGVFLGRDFLSVTKDPSVEWLMMKPRILAAIMDHYASGRPAVNDGASAASSEGGATRPEDEPIIATIKELLDTRIRPAVAQDGGDIIFHRYEDGIVYLEMHGACSGCPSSTVTLKSGIENMLRHYIPEVVEVRPAMM